MKNDNPWNLTARQAQLLDLWCLHGSQTEAAKQAGIATKSMSTTIKNCAQKMGVQSNLRAALLWDRFAYGREGSNAPG